MLFWLAARHGIRGMLYYSIDQWSTWCGLPSSMTKTPPACRNISRLRNNSPMTNFRLNPMDGDGSFVYPGQLGMVSSIRLENLADGIEDAQLFAHLGVNATSFESNAADLIEQLMPGTNGPNWNTSWGREEIWKPDSKVFDLMESLRRQAAHRIMAEAASAVAVKGDDESTFLVTESTAGPVVSFATERFTLTVSAACTARLAGSAAREEAGRRRRLCFVY